jgi:hypothetical protein
MNVTTSPAPTTNNQLFGRSLVKTFQPILPRVQADLSNLALAAGLEDADARRHLAHLARRPRPRLGPRTLRHRQPAAWAPSGRGDDGDNPYLDVEEYRRSLANLDPVRRAQLETGDWSIRQGGAIFERQWFRMVDRGPGRSAQGPLLGPGGDRFGAACA